MPKVKDPYENAKNVTVSSKITQSEDKRLMKFCRCAPQTKKGPFIRLAILEKLARDES
jgi:hypothetical protein